MPGPGYFSDDSMIRRVMRKRAVGLTYGLRALVIGAVHPLLFVGTAENTAHRATPYTRLALTGRLFEAVFLGDKDEADRALAFTRKRHLPVDGVLPEDAGPHHPAGSHYSALDPHLMFMTMAFTADSAEVMHDLLVRKLTRASGRPSTRTTCAGVSCSACGGRPRPPTIRPSGAFSMPTSPPTSCI